MKLKKCAVILLLFVVLMLCVGAISAESNNTMNYSLSETGDEFISLSNDEQEGNVGEFDSILGGSGEF